MKSDLAKQFGHVAILYGGDSTEREISLISGKRVYEALQQCEIQCVLIDTKENMIEQLQRIKPDCVFIALHGSDGENGVVQAVLQSLKIPYTGSSHYASAISMDKYRSKLIWRSLGLPTPDFCMVTSSYNIPQNHPFPCFVKATCQGSTVGVYPVDEKKKLPHAIDKALQYGKEVLIEQWIQGREFSVPILDNEALPAVQIVPVDGFYSYEAKYKKHSTQYLIPCGLSSEKEKKIKELAKQSFISLGCTGWGRVDCLEDSMGRFWLLEVNSVPGLGKKSLVPMVAEKVGINLQSLFLKILSTSHIQSKVTQ